MTTQGQEQGWFAKNWKWLTVLGALGVMSCCCLSVMALGLAEGATTSSARVDCGTPGPGGVDCDVKRTGGLGAFEACWELEITCVNGGKMVGSGCGKVAAGETGAKVNLPPGGFSNQEACDAPKSGEVQRLTVEDN
jgi:hypothetical protein